VCVGKTSPLASINCPARSAHSAAIARPVACDERAELVLVHRRIEDRASSVTVMLIERADSGRSGRLGSRPRLSV
jgi:hypothetical protein